MDLAHLPDPPVSCPDRAAVPEPLRWNPVEPYLDWETWEREFAAVSGALKTLPALRDTITADGAALLAGLRILHDVEMRLRLLRVYASLRRDEDTRVGESTERNGRAATLAVRFAEAVSWFEPLLLGMDPAELAALRAGQPELALYDHFFADLLRQRPHVLSESEEALLAAAGAVAQGPPAVFQALNDADLTFPEVRDEQGRSVRLTRGLYARLLRSADRRVREEAFRAFAGTYGGVVNTMAANLDAEVKSHVFQARARRHPDTLNAALFGDAVPADVYHSLVATVERRREVIHRYVRLRGRVLDLSPLQEFDLYNPLFPGGEFAFPYGEACARMLAALAPLGERYTATVRRAVTGRWIDVCETPGKRSGAYSTGTYGMHPYILLNWSGQLRDTFTLVHEMGHAMHSWHTTGAQPYVYADYPIFTAEVASTCNELLLMHHLLETVTDRDRRLFLLETFLDEINSTVFRQTMFAEFERHIHRLGEQGQTLSAPRLRDDYLELLARYWGPDVAFDTELSSLTWCRVPHFYYNYYVYQYATAFSASVVLSRGLLSGDPAARERSLDFLRSGSSRYPLETLRRAGADLSTSGPYEAVCDLFGELLDEIERMSSEED